MHTVITGLSLAIGCLQGASQAAQVHDTGPPPGGGRSHAERFAEVDAGEADPLSVPFPDGIVWYGNWEDAMAEQDRTGKAVMLHFGSPRCPSKGVNVPGTW